EWAFARAGRRIDRAVADAAEPTRRLAFLSDEVVAGVLDLAHVRAQARPLRPAVRDMVARPYKGLATLDASDTEIFHGRDQLVAELVSRLVERRLLAVVGAAGTGKSSLVRAGLLPALAAGVLPASSRWRQVIVKPGVGGSLAEHVAPHLDDLRRVELNFDGPYDLPLEQFPATARRPPVQPGPGQHVPAQHVPYQDVPDQRVPDQRAPDYQAPDQQAPDQMGRDQQLSDQLGHNQLGPDQRLPMQRVEEASVGEIDATAATEAQEEAQDAAQDAGQPDPDQLPTDSGGLEPGDDEAYGSEPPPGNDGGPPSEGEFSRTDDAVRDGYNAVHLEPSHVDDLRVSDGLADGVDGGPAQPYRSGDTRAYWEAGGSYGDSSYGDLAPATEPYPNTVPGQESILLVVDQFEEVFTVLDADAREAFLATVVRLAETNRVVLTMRADFYARCAEFVEFAALLSANTVLMRPMTDDEMRRAIELPAAAAGLTVQDGLAEHIVAEARQVRGLAHLSAALYSLWENRTTAALTIDDYDAGGGVAAALENLAENAFDTLSTADECDAARRIMLCLCAATDANALVRRRATLAEVVATAGPAGPATLEKLAAGRLITVSERTVEVAHEALLEHWPRVRMWLDDALTERGQRRHLAEAADAWAEVGDAGGLYRGARLAAALDLARQGPDDLSPLERDFLDASQRLVLAADLRRRRRVVRLWRYLAASIVVAILAIMVAAAAVTLQLRSSAAGAKADGLRLASLAVAEPDLRKALLLAVAATQLDDGTAETIRTVLMGSPDVVAAAGSDVTTVALSPDGRTVAAATMGGTIWLYGADSLDTTGRLDLAGHGPVNGLAFTPDGRR
ncbi:MAG: hypothetical protein QOE61_3729, partial [Micromonosporaceae bacterium]|nr:hypothetical protein [Micromonosporaceae bacterium]